MRQAHCIPESYSKRKKLNHWNESSIWKVVSLIYEVKSPTLFKEKSIVAMVRRSLLTMQVTKDSYIYSCRKRQLTGQVAFIVCQCSFDVHRIDPGLLCPKNTRGRLLERGLEQYHRGTVDDCSTIARKSLRKLNVVIYFFLYRYKRLFDCCNHVLLP